MKKLFANPGKREHGVSTVELSMLLPILFVIILGVTELSLYLFTSNVVHYAAFMAARSYIVNKDKSLEDIGYPNGGGAWKSHRLYEAAAKRIIFESLPWEHRRIISHETDNPIKRSYNDPTGESGAVRVNMKSEDGIATAEILYCMPVGFGLHEYFIPETYTGPCSNVTGPSGSGTYTGIPIRHKVELQENL
jgi:hypothetical protein